MSVLFLEMDPSDHLDEMRKALKCWIGPKLVSSADHQVDELGHRWLHGPAGSWCASCGAVGPTTYPCLPCGRLD